MSRLIFVMGPTCAGKSTFMNKVRAAGHGVVEVGKMMRAKYPPSYFQGEAAPEKTAKEAWSMMMGSIRAQKDCAYIFIDGQPRDITQAESIKRSLSGHHECCFVVITAPISVRIERAKRRFENDSASLDLAMRRLTGETRDEIKLYEVITKLLRFGFKLNVYDTRKDSVTVGKVLHDTDR